MLLIDTFNFFLFFELTYMLVDFNLGSTIYREL